MSGFAPAPHIYVRCTHEQPVGGYSEASIYRVSLHRGSRYTAPSEAVTLPAAIYRASAPSEGRRRGMRHRQPLEPQRAAHKWCSPYVGCHQLSFPMGHNGRAGRLSCPSASQTLQQAFFMHNLTFKLGLQLKLTLTLLQLPLRVATYRALGSTHTGARYIEALLYVTLTMINSCTSTCLATPMAIAHASSVLSPS